MRKTCVLVLSALASSLLGAGQARAQNFYCNMDWPTDTTPRTVVATTFYPQGIWANCSYIQVWVTNTADTVTYSNVYAAKYQNGTWQATVTRPLNPGGALYHVHMMFWGLAPLYTPGVETVVTVQGGYP